MMRIKHTLTVLLTFLPLASHALKLELNGSESKISYDVIKHLPVLGGIPVHGDLTPQGSVQLRGALSATAQAEEPGNYLVNGQVVLPRADFGTRNEIRDELVQQIIDDNGIVVDIHDTKSTARTGQLQSSAVHLTINGITLPVPLTYVLVISRQGSGHFVTMKGQMAVDRSKFHMQIHGIASAGDFLIDKTVIVKFSLVFQN